MTDAASVESDVRIRLFCALRLPDETVHALVEWQALLQERRSLAAGRFRPVAPDNLHVTLAFLGHRPRRDVEPIAAELEAASRAARPVRLSAQGYRETRSVGMLVLDDAEGLRPRSRPICMRASCGSASTSPSVVPGFRTSPWCDSGSGHGSVLDYRSSGRSFRPEPLSTIPCSARQGRSTWHFRNLA